MSRALIVTGDDVGLHPGINEGVVRAHERGIVTACSVVAGGPAFTHAVELLRRAPALEVGVHLAVVEGVPLSPPGEVPSLVGADGTFAPSAAAFIARYLRGGVREREVEIELRRQVARVQAAGLVVTHLNGHQHLHVLPAVSNVVRRLATEFGVGYLRVPAEATFAGAAWRRKIALYGLRVLARRARRAARGNGLGGNDVALGIGVAGHLTVARLAGLLRRCTAVAELVCHPGVGSERIARTYAWGYDWDVETAALCSREVRVLLDAAGIVLTTPARAAAATLPT